MKKRLLALMLLLCLTLSICPAAAEASTEIWVETAFQAPGKSAAYTCAFPFDEALFLQDPSTYHHRLAQSSLGLAVSAFRDTTDDLQSRDINIWAFLTKCGFEDITTIDYDVHPTIDTIGTAMAHRTVSAGGESCTLIALGISGAGYQDEWMSNFTIGNATTHVGFTQAAEKVIARLKAYIEEQGITGHVRLWLSGYSRAAAVSNLTAAMAQNDAALSFDAIYAYTFATPNTTRDVGDYPNIFNIVGQFDPVPSVPFHQWGYDRHGTTLYLPAREVNSDYEARVQPVRTKYQEITGGETYWVNPEANWLVHKLCEFLCEFVEGAGDYEAHYQQVFIDVWDAEGGILGKLRVCAQEIMKSQAIVSELNSEKNAFWTLLSEESYNLLLEEIGWRSSDWNGAVALTANVMGEHYPQRYVAWMLAYDTAEDTFSPNTNYKRLALTGAVDFTVEAVYDDRAVKVGEVKDGKVRAIEDSTFSIMQVGNEYLVTCPGDTPLSLTMTATADGELHYVVREHEAGYIAARTLVFSGIPLKKGVQLGSLIEAENGQSSAASMLFESETNTIIEPTADTLNGDTVVSASADMTLQGNNTNNFLAWLLAAVAVALLIIITVTVAGARHHRKKNRGEYSKAGKK